MSTSYTNANHSSSAGVLITSGAAHTKGNYGTFATAAEESDQIKLYAMNSTGANRNFLFDIAVGGAGSEVIIYPNLHLRLLASSDFLPLPPLPIRVPAGTPVRLRCQDETGSGAIKFAGYLIPTSAIPGQVGISTTGQVSAPLSNTATSAGNSSLDAGATINTFTGTAGNICNANAPIVATHLMVGTRDATAALVDFLTRIKVNGNVATPELYHRGTNGDGNYQYHPLIKLDTPIAVNDTVTAEVSCSGNTVGSRELRVSVVLINLPAASSSGTIIQGAAMQRAMKDTETTASRKRLFFDIRDSAGAAWAGSVTGLKAQLSISGATEAASANDIVRVAGALHYVELDNTEAAAAAAGDVICARVAATTGRLESVAYFEITADDSYASGLTAGDIADAVVEAELDTVATYSRTSNTAVSLTGPSGTRALTIVTDAAYEPIESIS